MTKEQLLAKAADEINKGGEAYKEFIQSRELPVSVYSSIELLFNLKECLSDPTDENTGWWYGRITDPRRVK